MAKFSELLAGATREGDALVLDVPADWAQGRSVFGGLQAAFAVVAMRHHVPAIPLRTLQVTFVGPVAGRVRAEVSVLRTGASVTHLEARLSGSDGLAAIVVGVFGKPRRSVVAVERTRPEISRDQAFAWPYIAGAMPAFIQHFDATLLRGALPYTGGAEPHHVIEVGMHDDGPASETHAIAFADFIPPIGLTFLQKFAHGSTLTWMIELVTDRFDGGLAGWRVDAELHAARDGYTSQSLVLWAPDGRPVALGHQTMVVFG